MEKTELLQMFENCVNWCNEGEGREIYGMSYAPSSFCPRPYIMIAETGVGPMAVRSANDILDIPAWNKEQKRKEFEKLKAELGE